MYCVKCKKHTKTINQLTFTSKNGHHMLKGVCSICGKTTTQFVKTSSGLFNTLVNKLPFEFHLPGHNFTGPGTRLDRRLNPDDTLKDWSTFWAILGHGIPSYNPLFYMF